MWISVITTLAPWVAIGIAGYGALIASREYHLQGLQKRAEKCYEWNAWFDSKEGFGESIDGESILHYLERDDEKLHTLVTWHQRERLLTFYEEIALAVNSGLLREEIAIYMFGYYALKIHKSTNFWIDFDAQDEPYWKLWKYFSQLVEAKYDNVMSSSFDPAQLRF